MQDYGDHYFSNVGNLFYNTLWTWTYLSTWFIILIESKNIFYQKGEKNRMKNEIDRTPSYINANKKSASNAYDFSVNDNSRGTFSVSKCY